MITAIALAMALAGPADDAEAAASGSKGFVVTGGFEKGDEIQWGFTDIATLQRKGDLVDVWQVWAIYRRDPLDPREVAYYRRHYILDCAARTDRMIGVQAFTASGELLEQADIEKPVVDKATPNSNAFYSLAFACEGIDPPHGHIEFANLKDALAGGRTAADITFEETDKKSRNGGPDRN